MSDLDHYRLPVNEVFWSVQGEGHHVGRPSVFVRFAGCNLKCSRDGEAGFDCDTEFTSNTRVSLDDLRSMVQRVSGHEGPDLRVILTGGEPSLHLNDTIVQWFYDQGWSMALETNGTHKLPAATRDWWISVSPKTAEHTLRVQWCDELRYVRNHTQSIPVPVLEPEHKFVSPAWSDDPAEFGANLRHCVRLAKDNWSKGWRLSTQQHKSWNVL